MKPQRRRRLYWILAIIIACAAIVSLVLYALNQNINLFYTPTQVQRGEAPKNHTFRMGGLVEKGSVVRDEKTLSVQFVLTDLHSKMTVQYQGILPDLFREGQGIVAEGQLNAQGVFVADQVLAKHDENYMPPEVQDALKNPMGTNPTGSKVGQKLGGQRGS
jgi:cytochrome c-type biogenesis protein CcmE